MFGSRLVVGWQLAGSWLAVGWKLAGSWLAVAWQLPGSCLVVAWHFFNVNLIYYFQVSNGLTSLDSVNLQELPNLPKYIKRV